jgi:hypothetical protein
MNRLIFLLCTTLFSLSGCSTIGSYSEIDDGGFLVSVNSNDFSTKKKIKEKFTEKSREACNGEYTIRKILVPKVQVIKTYGEYATTSRVLVQRRIIDCINRTDK